MYFVTATAASERLKPDGVTPEYAKKDAGDRAVQRAKRRSTRSRPEMSTLESAMADILDTKGNDVRVIMSVVTEQDSGLDTTEGQTDAMADWEETLDRALTARNIYSETVHSAFYAGGATTDARLYTQHFFHHPGSGDTTAPDPRAAADPSETIPFRPSSPTLFAERACAMDTQLPQDTFRPCSPDLAT
jgi:hypothetical protein